MKQLFSDPNAIENVQTICNIIILFLRITIRKETRHKLNKQNKSLS